jgi:sulfur carrier protein
LGSWGIATIRRPPSLLTPICQTTNSKAAELAANRCRIIRLVIQVIVNGATRRFDAPLDVAGLLEQLAMAGKKVAVERNGEIVPKSAHAATLLADGDELEIVVAVGGG